MKYRSIKSLKHTKPNVAIVRGPGLSKWEMQIYEPLTSKFNLVGLGTKKPVNDINGIKFPVKQLWCPGQYLTKLPKSIPVLFNLLGDTQFLWGFQDAVGGYDIVHSVELSNDYTMQAIRAKKRGLVKAVTLTVYENIPYIFDEYDARKKIKEEVIEGADHFLAINEAAKQALLIEGVDQEKISIVPQSVETSVFRPKRNSDRQTLSKIRKRYGINDDDFLVLSVGRMVWEKGWFDIVPAAAYIKKKLGKKIKFLLVGDGSEKNKIAQLIKDSKVGEIVKLTGFLPYSQMADVFRSADIFLYATLPTKYWNAQFGGVLIEAMATGLPIVGTLSGGTRDDTVGPGGGLFVQPQDFFNLAKSIIKLYEDKNLRTKISKRNRKFAEENYSVNVVSKKIQGIWSNLLYEQNKAKMY